MLNRIKNISTDLASCLRREVNSYRIRGMSALLFLTCRCTSRCVTCNIWKRNAQNTAELDWEQWEKVLARMHHYGIKTVEIFGGDALLRKDVIFKMIRFCSERGIETFFPTNSILLDRKTAGKLAEAGLGTIYVSLDGTDDSLDRIRGVEGAFDKVKRAIEHIAEARGAEKYPRLAVCSTISNLNYLNFERVIEFLSDYPVNAVYPRIVAEFPERNIAASEVAGVRPEPYFVSSEDKSHLLNQEQISRFRETIHRLKKNGHSMYINLESMDMSPDAAFTHGEYGFTRCHACRLLVTVNPNGDIIPCPFYPGYVTGNLCREKSLENIWGNARHREFVNAQQAGRIAVCNNCSMPSFYPGISKRLQYYAKRASETYV